MLPQLFLAELNWRWYEYGVAVSPFHADRERGCVEDEAREKVLTDVTHSHSNVSS